MHHDRHFRTYLVKIWLVWFCILPLSLLVILGLADSSTFRDESNSLYFVLCTLIALLFTIPIVLYFFSISAILTRLISDILKLRIFTIILIIIGLFVTAVIVYTSIEFTTEQIMYGAFFLLLYSIGIIICGLKFKI